MANFTVPQQAKKIPSVIPSFNGVDSYNLRGDISRPTYMKNIIKKDGLHQIRPNLEQKFITSASVNSNDDSSYDIKYIGDFTSNGVVYYIKISEHLGDYLAENASSIMISIWQTPDVKNVLYCTTTTDGYYSHYINDYQRYSFTNVGITGNDRSMYNDIIFNDNKYVFTPIGILTFKCSNTVLESGKIELKFETQNVLNNPYIPTTHISVNPDGTMASKVLNESLNLLSNQRIVQYLSDGTSTAYHLPEKYIASVDKIQQMDNNGIMKDVATSAYSVNLNTGVITFTTAPAVSPVDGKDNIYVTYTKTSDLTSETTISSTVNSSGNITKADITLTKTTVGSTITVTPSIVASTGSSFVSSTDTITSFSIKIYGNNVLYVDKTVSTLGTISASSFTIPSSTSSYGITWTATISCNYNRTVTTGVPGSTSGSYSSNSGKLNGVLGSDINSDKKTVTYLGLYCDYTVIPSSDGYADIIVYPKFWANGAASYGFGTGDYGHIFHTWINGNDITGGSSGAMYTNTSQGDVYFPDSPTACTKRVYYSGSGQTATIKIELRNFNCTIAGTSYANVHSNTFVIGLPTITLNSQTTTTYSYTDSGNKDFTDTIDAIKNSILTAPGSAKLSCYYSAKYVTVFGYENDMRVFVSDGTNYDCYSDANKINYFPDDNYTSLGEKTNIKGYGILGSYLYTFKDGEDTVYVRYGSTYNNKTAFPAVHTSYNIPMLGIPIQLQDELLIITENGVQSIYYNGSNLRQKLRSEYINNEFLYTELNWSKMQYYRDDNLLHIVVGPKEYVADISAKSNSKNAEGDTGTKYTSSNDYQYEWYICEYPSYANSYSINFKKYLKKDLWLYQNKYVDDIYYFGYTNLGVYQKSYTGPKVDIIMTSSTTKTYLPIKAKMITQFIDFGNTLRAKTIRALYLNTMSRTNDKFYIGYIDETGTQTLIEKVYTSVTDYETPWRNGTIDFPKLIQIYSKIRKFMNIKLYLENIEDEPQYINADTINSYQNMTFLSLALEYQEAGKYRGE